VTHLRKMMLEELQRRNYAETTISSYIRIVEDFSRRFQRPPERLGPQQIREYQAELFKKRKLAASTVTVYLGQLDRNTCGGEWLPDQCATDLPLAAIALSSAIASEGSSNAAAARFSRRWSVEDVPGISRMLGER
jgi:hypothetical protein